MFDAPSATMILDEVRKALDAGLSPGFPQKVAANALGIALRELELGPALAAAEAQRLRALLHLDGELPGLNEALVDGIVAGRFAEEDPALLAHLIQTTIGRMAVDQPGYAAFRAVCSKGKEG